MGLAKGNSNKYRSYWVLKDSFEYLHVAWDEVDDASHAEWSWAQSMVPSSLVGRFGVAGEDHTT